MSYLSMSQRNNSKNNSISSSENTSKNEEIILELFSSKIKGKHMELLEEKGIIHENLMLFIANFLKEKQKIKKNLVFLSQIVLIKLPKIMIKLQKKPLEFQYIFFMNKEKKIEENMNNYHYFLYLLQLNNHWAMASINLHSKICVIYTFCKFTKDKMQKMIKTIHQNFMNFNIKSFVFEDFFEKFNEKDDFESNCSIFVNHFMINIYNNGKMPSKNSVLNKEILKENLMKILKILKAYRKKNDINSQDNRLVDILEEIPEESREITKKSINNEENYLKTALKKFKKTNFLKISKNSVKTEENSKEKTKKIDEFAKIEEISEEKKWKIEEYNDEKNSTIFEEKASKMKEISKEKTSKIDEENKSIEQFFEENKGFLPKIPRILRTLSQNPEENPMKIHAKNKLIGEIFNVKKKRKPIQEFEEISKQFLRFIFL